MTIFGRTRGRATRAIGIAVLAGLPGALSVCLATAAQASSAAPDAQQQETWRAALARTHLPGAGCFTADYPSTAWTKVACSTKPATPYIPRNGHRGFTVGNGNDYSAVVTGVISQGVGSFPSVTGVTKETGYDGANVYSLQLNPQFFPPRPPAAAPTSRPHAWAGSSSCIRALKASPSRNIG